MPKFSVFPVGCHKYFQWSAQASGHTTRVGENALLGHHMLQSEFVRACHLIQVEEERTRDSF